jgi:DNA replication protein DnaC
MNNEEKALMDTCLAEAGIERAEFSRLCRAADWYMQRMLLELQKAGWLERLRADAAEGEKRASEARARKLSSAICNAMKNGPSSMATTPEADLLAAVPAKLRDFASKWEPADGGVIIIGPTGSRKSLACAAMTARRIRVAFEAHDHGFAFRPQIAWARAIDLANARRQHPLGSEPESLTAAKEIPVLVLDDLGWEPVSDGTIPEILAHRYDRGLATVATSGTPYAELAARYTEAPLRRILESGKREGRIVSLFPPKPVSLVGGAR